LENRRAALNSEAGCSRYYAECKSSANKTIIFFVTVFISVCFQYLKECKWLTTAVPTGNCFAALETALQITSGNL
jgi:hypothetical protein